MLSARIRKVRPRVGSAGHRVLDVLDSDPQTVLQASALDLAAGARTSDATVIRTVQALGYRGLPELREAICEALADGSSPAGDMVRTLEMLRKADAQPIEAVLRTQQIAAAKLAMARPRAQLAAAVGILRSARQIVVCSDGVSSGLGAYAAAMLAQFGWPSRSLDTSTWASERATFEFAHGDVLLVLAPGRQFGATEEVMSEAARMSVPRILFAAGGASRLARLADRVVIVPSAIAYPVRAPLLAMVESAALVLAAEEPDRALQALTRLADPRDR